MGSHHSEWFADFSGHLLKVVAVIWWKRENKEISGFVHKKETDSQAVSLTYYCLLMASIILLSLQIVQLSRASEDFLNVVVPEWFSWFSGPGLVYPLTCSNTNLVFYALTSAAVVWELGVF